ncbi:hypothetical protein L227DRAFT_571565 [Lentinus tigrinus ALCF2SS1-6]|uniref:Uncharacterized protein n=1 Tax=Lentinus tigrinus ALCF2SS1-6 TaxID=1328759 RepID=A0A5C2SMY4_9APHY|nr:hypothetical protein L227DRAFT_571565 [Lentinus tigrinus ALCF2SS1-6]
MPRTSYRARSRRTRHRQCGAPSDVGRWGLRGVTRRRMIGHFQRLEVPKWLQEINPVVLDINPCHIPIDSQVGYPAWIEELGEFVEDAVKEPPTNVVKLAADQDVVPPDLNMDTGGLVEHPHALRTYWVTWKHLLHHGDFERSRGARSDEVHVDVGRYV